MATLFKKIGQAQHIALGFMSEQSMHKLAREKNAHKDCPEFAQVQQDLAEYQRKALDRLTADHKWRMGLLREKLEGELYNVRENANVSDIHASQGIFLTRIRMSSRMFKKRWSPFSWASLCRQSLAAEQQRMMNTRRLVLTSTGNEPS
jgi:hypothetical protein